MTESEIKKRDVSLNTLQWFYTMVLSLAVVQAVQQVVRINSDNSGVFIEAENIITFLVFTITIIPFYQGAMRYLQDTYVISIKKLKKRYELVDFVFFFFEGMVFYGMALAIPNSYHFYLATILVLLVDVIWLLFVFFGNRNLFSTIRRWLTINLAAMLLILLQFKFRIFNDTWQYVVLGLIMLLRTVADYIYTWKFYWPSANDT